MRCEEIGGHPALEDVSLVNYEKMLHSSAGHIFLTPVEPHVECSCHFLMAITSQVGKETRSISSDDSYSNGEPPILIGTQVS